MITVHLQGGLGNQMFQYALALRLSKDYNTPIALNIVSLLNDPNAHAVYCLNIFNNKEPIPLFPPMRFYQFARRVPKFVLKVLAWVMFKISKIRQNILTDKDNPFIFHQDILDSASNHHLMGYWQSYKYFEGVEDRIRHAFKFTLSKSATALEYRQQIETSVAPVCIHVRRNDYLKIQKIYSNFWIIDIDYIQAGLQIIKIKCSKPLDLFIFSDDINWCKENLKLDYPMTFIENKGAKNFADDMWLMTQCHYFIIANSSFSWWGAWLSEYVNKIVVAPKSEHWHPLLETKDLIPDNWIRI